MSSPLAILAAVFGAAAGAFVPHVAWRLAVPFGDPPRLSWLGWVRAGGSRTTVLTASAACWLLAVEVGASVVLPVLLLAVVLGVLLSEIDLRCLRLPDPIVGALALAVLPVGLAGSVGRGLAAAVVVGSGYLALSVLSGGRLGLGDVKLAAVLAYVLGSVSWTAVGLGVLIPHSVNGSVALFMLLRGRGRDLPLGPSLLIGALLALTA